MGFKPLHAVNDGPLAALGPGPGIMAENHAGTPMPDSAPVLTIDGPSGAGKGTVSRIAARLVSRAGELDADISVIEALIEA